MRLAVILLALASTSAGASGFGSAFGGGGGGGTSAHYVPTERMLDGFKPRLQSLFLVGPYDGSSASGDAFWRTGNRACFDWDGTFNQPRCNVRIMSTDSLTITISATRVDLTTISLYGAIFVPQSETTCNAGILGKIITTSPASTRTRLCLCTSDGGGTPAYAWQNVVTGTVGSSSACDP